MGLMRQDGSKVLWNTIYNCSSNRNEQPYLSLEPGGGRTSVETEGNSKSEAT